MEDILDLRNFILYFLRRWRFIFVSMAVLAVAVGGYRFYVLHAAASDHDKIKEDQARYERSLSSYNTEKESLIHKLESANEQIKAAVEYNEESIIMQINFAKQPFVSISYYIEADQLNEQAADTNKTSRIVQAYLIKLKSMDVMNKVNVQLQKPVKNELELRELFNIYTDVSGSTINIDAGHSDEDELNVILETMKTYIESLHSEMIEQVGEHRLNLLKEDIYYISNPSVEELQQNKKQNIINMYARVDEIQGEIDRLRKPAPPVISNAGTFKASIKSALLGLVGGFGFSVVVLFFFDVSSGKVKKRSDIEKITEHSVLAVIDWK